MNKIIKYKQKQQLLNRVLIYCVFYEEFYCNIFCPKFCKAKNQLKIKPVWFSTKQN